MKLHSIIFAAPGYGTDTVNPQSWDTTFQDVEEEKGSVDKRPDDAAKMTIKYIPFKKKKKPKQQEDKVGLHRDFNTVTNYGGGNPEVAVGQDGQKSESTRQFYYAPGQTGPTKAALKVIGKGESGWISPDGTFYLVPDGVSHISWLIDHGQELLTDEQMDAVLACRDSDSDSVVFNSFDQLFLGGWVRCVGGLAFELERQSLPNLKKYLKSSTTSADREDTVYIDFPGEPSLVIPLKEAYRLDVEAASSLAGESGNIKFWIDPKGEFYQFDFNEEHDAWLVEYNSEYSHAEHEEALARDWAMADGWTRGGVDNGTLFIQLGDGKDVPDVLSRAPQEYLFCRELVVQDFSGKGDTTVPVLEGEDALAAWEHRKDIRHRVEASEFTQTYHESVDNLLPQDPPGYDTHESDSNFSQKTRPRIAPKKDKDVQLDTLPGDKSYPDGAAEPPDYADSGMGNMLYPLAGLNPLIFLAVDPDKLSTAELAKYMDKAQKEEFDKLPEAEQRAYAWARYWEDQGVATPPMKPVEAPPAPQKTDPLAVPEEFSETENPSPALKKRAREDIEYYYRQQDPRHIEVSDQELKDIEENLTEGEKMEIKDLPEEDKKVALKKMYLAERARTENQGGGNSRSKSHSPLNDPALSKLDPPMTDTEKLFTTIPQWQGDAFFVDTKKLDKPTLDMIKKDPQSDPKKNHYFTWQYIPKEKEEAANKRLLKEKGFTVSTGEDSLIVTRLEPWKKLQAK